MVIHSCPECNRKWKCMEDMCMFSGPQCCPHCSDYSEPSEENRWWYVDDDTKNALGIDGWFE